MSVKLLSHTIDSNAIEIEKEDIGVIEALIKGDPSHGGYVYVVVFVCHCKRWRVFQFSYVRFLNSTSPGNQ